MIRPAVIGDMPRLLELARVMHEEAPAYRGWAFDEPKVERLLRSLMQTGCVLVAENEVIVGGVVGMCTEHWFSTDKVASELALFVEPSHRHGTIAIRLVRGFLEWARLQGAKRVGMGVTTGVHPEATGLLYQACGLSAGGFVYMKDF
jgi:GNAT superfamily N-acetyltransferase